MKKIRRHPLLILLVAYLVLGSLYSVTVPLFEAPDERYHYGYVRHLASEHRLPPRGENSPAGHEASQPPFYYAVAALSTAWRNPEFRLTLHPNRYFGNYQAPGTVNDNKNILLHSDLERFPWRGAVLTVHIARSVNLLFGALTVGATYLLAREIFSRQLHALSAAAIVALMPQFLFISSVINNDIAASAFSTVTLWLLVGGIRRGVSMGRTALLGISIGLAALSKVSALALVPLTLSVVALNTWWRTTDSRPHQRLKVILLRSAIILGVAFVISGWWYVRNSLLYDDPVGLQTHFATWWKYEQPLPLFALWSQLPGVALSFWAAFGMGNIHLPKAAYVFMMSVAVAAVAGLGCWVWEAWRTDERPGPRAWSLAVLAVWFVMVLAALLRWMQLVKAALGRLLFPAIGALAVLAVWGVIQFISHALQLVPDASSVQSRIPHIVLTLLVVVCFCISAAAPFVAIRPAYARPELLSPQEIAHRTQSDEIRFGDSIRLAGHQLDRRSAHPGEEISVTLCWACTGQMEKEYAYFVHVLGRDETIVGARDTYPGLGRFPTTQWAPGDAFCDVVRVPVDDQAPPQVVYDLEVGWYEPETGRRLSASDSHGNVMDLVVLEQVRIAPQTPAAVTVPHRIGANLGDRITLLGYRLSEPDIRKSEPFTVTLYWEAQTAIEDDYTVFVHLAADDVPPHAQDDSHPRNGLYPTSVWEAGEVVADPHVLRIPESLPGGDYELLAGMYLLETGERLLWLDQEGTPRGDYVPLRKMVIHSGDH